MHTSNRKLWKRSLISASVFATAGALLFGGAAQAQAEETASVDITAAYNNSYGFINKTDHVFTLDATKTIDPKNGWGTVKPPTQIGPQETVYFDVTSKKDSAKNAPDKSTLVYTAVVDGEQKTLRVSPNVHITYWGVFGTDWHLEYDYSRCDSFVENSVCTVQESTGRGKGNETIFTLK